MRPEQVAFDLPKLGKGNKALMAVMTVLGVAQAITFLGIGDANAGLPALARFSNWATKLWCVPSDVMNGEVWRIFTAGLLTHPLRVWPIAFTLLALYFLGSDLERRWGPGRYLRFFAIASVVSYGLVVLVDQLVPIRILSFHFPVAIGAEAALTALAIAWGNLNRERRILLFFFLPVSGAALIWLTIAFSVLLFIYPASIDAGPVANFGGLLVGLTLGGSPSPLRRFYLQGKLWWLKKQGKAAVQQLGILPPKTKRPLSRAKAPLLRVVRGGEDKPPPKDKRYLN